MHDLFVESLPRPLVGYCTSATNSLASFLVSCISIIHYYPTSKEVKMHVLYKQNTSVHHLIFFMITWMI